jgi:Zn-dependent peptidase ImmA (M78 family)
MEIAKYKKISPIDLLKTLNITTPPVDPFELAKKIGIKVNENLDWNRLHYDGEIYLNEEKKPEIWINPTDHINRQRFTLAHELGHLVNDVLPHLDKFKDPIRDDYKTLKRGANYDLKEMRANKFAAAILMPKDMLIEVGSKIIEEYNEEKKEKMPIDILIKILSNKFEVSEQAMEYRLKNLGLIK